MDTRRCWTQGVCGGWKGCTEGQLALWPGHLGIQGAAVVSVVDYCNKQIEPNPPERKQRTTCSRPRLWSPGFVPCCCSSSQCVVLSVSTALPLCGSAWEHKGCLGTAPALLLSAGQGALCRAWPGWAGMPPEQCSSSRAPEAVQSSQHGSSLPASKDGAPWHQQGPQAFYLGFSLAYT